MNPKTDDIGASLKRINALLTWWGIPNIAGAGATESQIKRFQKLAADLQAVYGEASGREGDAWLAANDGMGKMFAEILRARGQQDLLAAESELVASLSEGVSRQAEIWAEATQKVNKRCAAFARETSGEICGQGQSGPSAATRSPRA